MEPAAYRLAVLAPQPDALWDSLQAELDRHGAPLIAMTREDGAVEFTADTWEPILRARLDDAVEAVWPHGEAWRILRPGGSRLKPELRVRSVGHTGTLHERRGQCSSVHGPGA